MLVLSAGVLVASIGLAYLTAGLPKTGYGRMFVV